MPTIGRAARCGTRRRQSSNSATVSEGVSGLNSVQAYGVTPPAGGVTGGHRRRPLPDAIQWTKQYLIGFGRLQAVTSSDQKLFDAAIRTRTAFTEAVPASLDPQRLPPHHAATLEVGRAQKTIFVARLGQPEWADLLTPPDRRGLTPLFWPTCARTGK
jgi:hypothetical protein